MDARHEYTDRDPCDRIGHEAGASGRGRRSRPVGSEHDLCGPGQDVGPGSTAVVGGEEVAADGCAEHFAVGHASERDATPEEWARVMFGDTPDLIERFLWSGVLGLRLSAGRAADTVAGWSIDGRGEDWIRLAATSGAVAAQLVVHATGSTLGLATFMRYDRSRGRMIWGPTSAVHRRLAPTLLRQTLAKAARD